MTKPAAATRRFTMSAAALLALGFASFTTPAVFAQPTPNQTAKPDASEPAPATKPASTPEKAPEKSAEKPAAKPDQTPASTAKPAAPVNPADQIMKDLEQSARNREGADPAATKTPRATTGTEIPTAKLLREGTFVTSKRGRMTRGSSGDWQINFDADAEGRIDPPMGLMPCMNLQAMEKLVEKGGDSVTFTISGQVFLYKGKNYLLPTMYIVNRKGDLSPAG
jgi:outer membrane biosynthesis protein TonB